MKFIHKEKGLEFETDNENLFSMLKREGYEPVKDKKGKKAAEAKPENVDNE